LLPVLKIASRLVPPDSLTPSASLEDRRLAVAAALRAVVEPPADPAPVAPAAAAAPVDTSEELAGIHRRLDRLAEQLERVEDKVDLIRDGDDGPLAWPVSVDSDSRLEVPPLEVSRGNSPAFDVLLGPPPPDSLQAAQRPSVQTGQRDSA
jgi:hypothetical protein